MFKWAAGQITRWHVHPTIHNQTVGDHTYGVLQWLHYIVPVPLTERLMLAALNHDFAELFTGDVPYTTKRLYPKIDHLLKEVEEDIHKNFDACYKLFRHETYWLKFADLTEMGVYAAKERKLGNEFMDEVLQNVISALTELMSDLSDMGQATEEMFTIIKRLKQEQLSYGK